MEIIHADEEMQTIEARLGWMLNNLYRESDRRQSTFQRPVLIGGTALRRAYGLTRPSTDLDFAVEDASEMDSIRRTIKRIMSERWLQSKEHVRTDDETGWHIGDQVSGMLLHYGGMVMPATSLELARFQNQIWTLPMSRLATMKVDVADGKRHKIRDLYDLGFIAEHYPGDLTERQLQITDSLARQLYSTQNPWHQNHLQDPLFEPIEPISLAEQIREAVSEAHRHIDGARRGLWLNQSQALATMEEVLFESPVGEWRTTQHESCVKAQWIAKSGEIQWSGTLENHTRAQSLADFLGLEDPKEDDNKKHDMAHSRRRGSNEHER